MKLVYKGILRDIKQLPKGNLPDNAVKFNEPTNFSKVLFFAFLFTLPALFLSAIFIVSSYMLHGYLNISYSMFGFFAFVLSVLPHELLHAICFGKNANVELFIAPQLQGLIVTSTKPISKWRYIVMSLMPNVIFTWLPLLVWMILPYHEFLSDFLFTLSMFSLVVGGADYMNVYNAFRQMPKGSLQQLSGLNSYWFMPSYIA